MHPRIGPIKDRQHHPHRPGPGNAHVPSEGGDARGDRLAFAFAHVTSGKVVSREVEVHAV